MVHILDLQFQGLPQVIAAFLIETGEGPVLVETGPHSVLKNLEVRLTQYGYDLSDVRHVFLTHIHLDHAGAAWALAREGATIYLHPFGQRHMADPSKLYQSAKRIYQDDMERLWGDLQPIPEKQLRVVEHRETISVGETTLTAWHTPGHAVHHIAWQLEDKIFSGDVAGVKIPGGMVVPPCPPPDINLEDWEDSLALIKRLKPRALYLTHFGIIKNIEEHFEVLRKQLWTWAEWIKPRWEQGESAQAITPKFQEFAAGQLKEAGADQRLLAQYDAANPAWMSVAGLLRYWTKRSERS